MTLCQAYLVKGWLLDKDPPKAVTEALDAVIELLSNEPRGVVTSPAASTGRADEVVAVFLGDLEVDPHGTIPPLPAPSEAPAPKPRRKHGMSPEAREAARQRMIDSHARRRVAKEAAREGKSPGEAGASPSGGVSDATRSPTW